MFTLTIEKDEKSKSSKKKKNSGLEAYVDRPHIAKKKKELKKQLKTKNRKDENDNEKSSGGGGGGGKQEEIEILEKKNSKTSDSIHFACGNPNVEEISGVIRLFKPRNIFSTVNDKLLNNNRYQSLEKVVLPKKNERSKIICILAVPSFFNVNDLLNFLGKKGIQKKIKKVRVIRDGSPNKYMVLLKFGVQDFSDEFFLAYNGKRFTLIDPEICKLVFVKELLLFDRNEKKKKVKKKTAKDGVESSEYDDSSTDDLTDDEETNLTDDSRIHSPFSSVFSSYNFPTKSNLFKSSMFVELPSCPVCLEKLDEEVSGIVTTMCNHEFHSGCLKKWGKSECPVCRYAGESEETCCSSCGVSENLWICMTCGNCGCGRYLNCHARDHFRESGHCYAMELESNRVWDYVGDNYVHRILENLEDGKLSHVENSKEHLEQQMKLKANDLEMQYNKLLADTLTSQRLYFEGKLTELLQSYETKLRDQRKEITQKLSKKMEHQVTKIFENSKIQSTKLKGEVQFLENMNKSLTQNQDAFKNLVRKKTEESKEKIHSKDKEIAVLKKEISDLMHHLSFGKKIQEEGSELKGGNLEIKPSPSTISKGKTPRSKFNQKKNKKKRKKKRK